MEDSSDDEVTLNSKAKQQPAKPSIFSSLNFPIVKKKKNQKKREGEGLEGESGEESQKENNAVTNMSKKKKKQKTLHGNFTNGDENSGNTAVEEDSQQGVGDSDITKVTEATSTHVPPGQRTLMSMWGKKM
jgi:hypothetical protein